jgi:peptidylprolyl isomerase
MQRWIDRISTQVQSWLKAGTLICLLLALAVGLSGVGLPSGNAVTDSKALLRNALPIDNPPVRQLQAALEDIAVQLRSPRRLGPVRTDLKEANRIVTRRQANILASVIPAKQIEASALLEQIKVGIAEMDSAVDQKDKERLWSQRAALLDQVGQLEEWMVDRTAFVPTIPDAFHHLPWLQGRAIVAIETSQGPLTVIVDGYNAPITAGNFVDLVQRGFYDGLEFTRAEESYVLQIGDPPGPAVGFIDPVTQAYRAIPLEVKVRGDADPLYGITLEEAGRYREEPMLPFSAYGALAMARPEGTVNGGSSQIFFFLFQPELTPAGANLLDGRYAVFGYTVEGKSVLEKLKEGDRIESASVVQGADYLVQPNAEAPAV